jgi:hypothetical protein
MLSRRGCRGRRDGAAWPCSTPGVWRCDSLDATTPLSWPPMQLEDSLAADAQHRARSRRGELRDPQKMHGELLHLYALVPDHSLAGLAVVPAA